jgi:adenylate cyclase
MTETRKLAAILVSDVVGYSRLAGADEDRTLARLRGLRSDLIDPAIAAHHGRIVKRTGDGSIIEFRSVVDAVRCAIEVQNGLIERNAGVPSDRRIEFRVGIHVGDVVEESDGDLMGDGVNIAARLEGIAKPGAICLSEDAYRQVSGRLEMEVTDLGPTQLKNIERPISRLFATGGGPGKAEAAGTHDASSAYAAEEAVRSRAARRRARGAANRSRGRRVVAPRREPARNRRLERGSAARGRTSFHRGVAVRQSQRRSSAGLPRRRANR